MPRDGNGATFVLSGTDPAYLYTRIGVGDITVETRDDSVLTTNVYNTKQPSTLKEPPLIELDYLHNALVTETFDALPGVVRTGASGATITFPKEVFASTTPMTITGSGYVMASTTGELTNDGLVSGTLSFQFDGVDFVVTPES